MRIERLMVAGVLLALAACGGGGGSGASAPSSGTGSSGTGSTGGSGSGGSSGGGTGGSTGGTTASPSLVQYATYQTVDSATENDSTVQFQSATKAGDALWIAVTVSDFGGVHQISVSDTQGNEFIALEQKDDPGPGYQTVAHFYAANIAGDSGAPDIVTIHWTYDDYKAVMISEIGNVTGTPLVAHAANIQDGLGAGTANVTSTAMSVGGTQVPALLIALSMNTDGGVSNIGGSGAPGPAASAGFTQVAQFWDYGANLATLSTQSVSASGEVAATFDAPKTDSFVTVAAVFH